MSYFEGRNVIITGAKSGIGLAFEQQAISLGASLVISVDSAYEEDSDEIIKATRVIHFKADTRDQRRLSEISISEDSMFYCVILSAGIQESEVNQSGKVADVNINGTANSYEVFLARTKKDGTIIFLSSDLITQIKGSDTTTYIESKRAIANNALNAMRRNPSLKIFNLLPGPVETPLFTANKSPEALARIDTEVGIMTPQEFAEQVASLIENPTSLSGSYRVYKKTGITTVSPQEMFTI